MKTNDLSEPLDLFRRIVEEMVEHPGHLKITPKVFGASATVTIQSHRADMGRLIGEGAENYRALVAILRAMGGRRRFTITVAPIMEPVVGEPGRYHFEAKANWPKEKIVGLLQDLLKELFNYAEPLSCDDDPATGITSIEAFVDRNEYPKSLQPLASAINRTFDAVGRANGRIISVGIGYKDLAKSPG